MQYARLFGILRENALSAHDITYAGHYEKSLCSKNDTRWCWRKIEIISLDSIALSRRLLILKQGTQMCLKRLEQLPVYHRSTTTSHHSPYATFGVEDGQVERGSTLSIQVSYVCISLDSIALSRRLLILKQGTQMCLKRLEQLPVYHRSTTTSHHSPYATFGVEDGQFERGSTLSIQVSYVCFLKS